CRAGVEARGRRDGAGILVRAGDGSGSRLYGDPTRRAGPQGDGYEPRPRSRSLLLARDHQWPKLRRPWHPRPVRFPERGNVLDVETIVGWLLDWLNPGRSPEYDAAPAV